MSAPFAYNIPDHEAEKASNSYLMSLVGLLAGLPLPIINLIATFIFFAANRSGPYFVRWHATQALLSQMSLLGMNSVAFWWTFGIFFRDQTVTNNYLAYVFTVGLFNIAEFAATVYAAIATRKGKHVEWWFFGTLTHAFCKP